MPNANRRRGDLPIYWRGGRAYLDGRRWGKKRQPLCEAGQKMGTTNAKRAVKIARALVQQWEDQQQYAERLGLDPANDLATAGDEHVRALEESGKSESYVRYTTRCLARALDFFDVVQAQQAPTATVRKRCAAPRSLATISPPDVRAFTRWLAASENGRRGERMGPGTIRQHLAALSGVFARAISDGRLPLGTNPVQAMMDKPSAPKSPTMPLEPWECALVLESARTLATEPRGDGRRPPLACAHPLLAFFLYTGAREDEARHAQVADLHFEGGPLGPWLRIRGTKTDGAERIVPLHPHLGEILHAHLRSTGRLGGLLFTAEAGQEIGDWRKTLDTIARRVGYAAGEVRTRRFRTSYATHRCTCDGVDANTVRLEMGHTDLQMMAQRYAAAQRMSERMGAEFSYRLERWAGAADPERLERLRAA
jgi:integrase